MSEALRLARRRRLGYLRIALGCVEVSLAALDDDPGLPALTSELIEVSRQTSVINHDVVVSSLDFVSMLWNPDAPKDHLDAMVAGVLAGPGVVAVDAALLGLVRLGRLDDVRSLLAQVSLSPLTDTWSVTWDAACQAEIAHALDEPGLAEAAAPILRRFAGRLGTAGRSPWSPVHSTATWPWPRRRWATGRPRRRLRTGRWSSLGPGTCRRTSGGWCGIEPSVGGERSGRQQDVAVAERHALAALEPARSRRCSSWRAGPAEACIRALASAGSRCKAQGSTTGIIRGG